MMAHTPGRWELVWFRGKGSVARIRLNGSTVYQVSDVTDPEFPSGTPRYNLDDLRLMSAAPELLAALKKWMERYSRDTERLEFYKEAIAMTQAAIAKAEGRVP
jgi:hypothetical protein